MKSEIILLSLLYLGGFYVKTEPIVTVSEGKLNGILQQSRNGRIYSAFLGIPYAQPPIENLRFTAPLPVTNWSGIRQANSFGNICPQFSGLEIEGDEDCLYLNVYTPRLNFNSSSNQTLLPVMIWLHGGIFIFGSGNFYKAEFLLDKDIVLVSINYRLGIFGFFTTGDSSAPGNYGLKDQVLALKWIQKNIRSFGGDPNQITLFGESSGGSSISLHAISEASEGLFQKYILESGNFLNPWAYQGKGFLSLQIRGVAALALCPFIFTKSLVNCMRKRSVKTLMYTSSLFPLIAWTPTDEPNIEGAFLTENPANLVDKIRDMPFMIGGVANEGLFISSVLTTNKLLPIIVKLFINPIIYFMVNYYLNGYKNKNLDKAIMHFYFNKDVIRGNNELFMKNFTRFLTDSLFFYPQIKMLETVTPKMKNSAYLFNFGYRGTFSMTNVTTGSNENIGVCHTDEMNYLFPSYPEDFGLKSANYTKKDESIIDIMVDLWTSFAINGKPTSDNLISSDLWKPFDSVNSTHLMIGDINNNTNPSVTLSHSFYAKRMNFWKKYSPIWS